MKIILHTYLFESFSCLLYNKRYIPALLKVEILHEDGCKEALSSMSH